MTHPAPALDLDTGSKTQPLAAIVFPTIVRAPTKKDPKRIRAFLPPNVPFGKAGVYSPVNLENLKFQDGYISQYLKILDLTDNLREDIYGHAQSIFIQVLTNALASKPNNDQWFYGGSAGPSISWEEKALTPTAVNLNFNLFFNLVGEGRILAVYDIRQYGHSLGDLKDLTDDAPLTDAIMDALDFMATTPLQETFDELLAKFGHNNELAAYLRGHGARSKLAS